MGYQKRTLITIAKKVISQKPLTADEVNYLLQFEKINKDTRVSKVLKKLAVPGALAVGFLFMAFPQESQTLIKNMPSWTNFPPPILTGVDYLWDLIGEPVRKANILYHIPNIILYSFGIFGIKKLIDAIDRRTWLDNVYLAKKMIQEQVANGKLTLSMRPGHSLLFVGKGDFIGTQFVLNHKSDETVTISEIKPFVTIFWNAYSADGLYDDLKETLIRSDGEHAGEYVFFPVKDDQIFLPGEKAYDLSPHKLDILCQNIRVIEKEMGWETNRIIIIGDKFHKSYVVSEDEHKIVPKSEDVISLGSIAEKYKNVTLLDPSDIVLKEVIKIAGGRQIVFRATKDGITEYKTRFYDRLKELGHKPSKAKAGILTIGYDIFEDQTEQQTLSHKINDYYPVVLSKSVHDALLRNGYKKEEFLYVPDLVLATLTHEAAQQ
jgi:SOS response regulatory protein OraA/RecX